MTGITNSSYNETNIRARFCERGKSVATKYIFITGGVVSSLGKGITAASLGRLLKSRGLKISNQKFDPYINVDPGNMSPYQHGEVFVTDDGGETDLDLGHYERFTDISLSKDSCSTMGKVYDAILKNERQGEYLGGTVQVIPHITNEIKTSIRRVATETHPDILITEIGGTVGDIESLPILEAIRQMRRDLGRDSVMYIHVTWVPYIMGESEAKTKPTQHSVKELRGIGIQPDAIVCRSTKPLFEEIEEKLALFCDVPKEAVIQIPNVENLYEIPLLLVTEGLDEIVLRHFRMEASPPRMQEWEDLVRKCNYASRKVKIAVVGKYVSLPDAYLSVCEALKHGGIYHGAQVEIDLIYSGNLEDGRSAEEALKNYHGILVPAGFGDRALEGKIKAIEYARLQKIPFLGICLGMQLALVEYARSVAGLDAGTEEAHPDKAHHVACFVHDSKNLPAKPWDNTGSMRLGSFPCHLRANTQVYKAYGTGEIRERHRHRLEFNNAYRDILERNGLVLSGFSPDGNLVEVVELKDHPWFVACQFQPEFKSRPTRVHPLYRDFIEAAIKAAAEAATEATTEAAPPRS